jgi:hypothetical protein
MDVVKSAVNAERAIKKIEEVLQTLLNSQENGNIENFANCFLHDSSVIHIGTDIDEYFSSWRDYLHWIDNFLLSRKGQEINAKGTNIQISEDKKTAWYSQLIDTCYETKGEITRIEGFRHTGVLIKTENGWKIVQSHISAPLNPES